MLQPAAPVGVAVARAQYRWGGADLMPRAEGGEQRFVHDERRPVGRQCICHHGYNPRHPVAEAAARNIRVAHVSHCSRPQLVQGAPRGGEARCAQVPTRGVGWGMKVVLVGGAAVAALATSSARHRPLSSSRSSRASIIFVRLSVD